MCAVHRRLTLSQQYLGSPISGLNDTAALPGILALGDLEVRGNPNQEITS